MALLNIPLPEAPPGGFFGGAQAVNALSQSNFQNAIAQAQAKYAPYNAYADALSKIAYGQVAPANAIAQILSGPAAANMSRDQYAQLANLATNYLKNVNTSSVLPPPVGRSGGLIGSLINAFSGKSQTQPIQQPSQNQMSNIPQPPSGYGPSQNQVANIPQQPPSPPPTSPQVGGVPPGQPFTQQAAGLNLPGTQGGYNPQSAAAAQSAGLTAGVTAEASNVAKQWDDQYKQSKAEANDSRNTLNILDKVASSREELKRFEKGPLFGKGPAVTTAAQNFDAGQAAIADAVARAQQQGHITITDRQTYNSMKPRRDMTDEAFKEQEQFIRGMNERILERPAFDLSASSRGLTPQQAEILWQYYIKKRPFYDAKNHKLLGKNLGTWEDFYSQPLYDEAFSPKKQREAEQKEKVTEKEKERPKQEKEKEEPKESKQKYKNTPYTKKDWEHTAKKYHMTVEQAMKEAGY